MGDALELGAFVQDTISEFKGTIIARVEYLDGHVSCEVQSGELHDGVPVEAQWINETRLVKATD